MADELDLGVEDQEIDLEKELDSLKDLDLFGSEEEEENLEGVPIDDVEEEEKVDPELAEGTYTPEVPEVKPKKKGRGRPKMTEEEKARRKAEKEAQKEAQVAAVLAVGKDVSASLKKRGRPKKEKAPAEESTPKAPKITLTDKSLDLALKDLVPLEGDRDESDFSGGENTPGGFAALKHSLAEFGQITPIVVVENGKGKYLVVAGKRRLAAAKELGWSSLKGVVANELTRNQALLGTLADNLHNRPAKALLQARVIKELMDSKEFENQTEVAELMGVTQSFVSKRLSLLELDPEVQAEVETNNLPVSVAAAAVRRRKKAEDSPVTAASIKAELKAAKKVALPKEFLIPEGETEPEKALKVTLSSETIEFRFFIPRGEFQKEGFESVTKVIKGIGVKKLVGGIQRTIKSNF